MHFTPVIRNVALQHAASACVSEICLLCELGFLFDMLQKAEGSICQATNLLKTLSGHPQGMSPNIVSRMAFDLGCSWSPGPSRRGPPRNHPQCHASGLDALPIGQDCARSQVYKPSFIGYGPGWHINR